MDHQDLINICIFEQSEGLLFSDKQVTDLFLIQNENIGLLFFCIQLLHVWSVLGILTWNKSELIEKYIISWIHYSI